MKVYISMTVSVVTSVWKLIIIIWEDRVSCDEQPSFPALNILCCAGNMSSQHRMCPHSPPPHLPRLQRNPLTLLSPALLSSIKLQAKKTAAARQKLTSCPLHFHRKIWFCVLNLSSKYNPSTSQSKTNNPGSQTHPTIQKARCLQRHEQTRLQICVKNSTDNS